MGSIHGSITVSSQKFIGSDIIKIPVPCTYSCLIEVPQKYIGGLISFASVLDEKGVCIDDVFDQNNRCLRMFLANDFDEGPDSLFHFGRTQVRQTVQNVNGRIEFRQQTGHFGLRLAISGEAQIYEIDVEPTSDDGGIRHSRTGSATSMGDRSSIEKQRCQTLVWDSLD